MSSEKKPNPHEVSLAKFLHALSSPVRRGYVYLNNGQIIREDTRQRWQMEGRIR